MALHEQLPLLQPDTATNDQMDIGGFFPGDTWAFPTSLSNNPQQPWFLVAGLTPTYQQHDKRFPLQLPAQLVAVGQVRRIPTISGSGRSAGASRRNGRNNVLAPYNVNTQQTRTRFWDGQDNMIRDDVTWLHGKHMIQFGGMYQHNFNWHQRTDNGGGINYYTVYQLGTTRRGAGIDMSGYVPAAVSVRRNNCGRDYAAVLGIVSISQIAYTRSGSDLAAESAPHPGIRQGHDSLLQLLRQRHLAHDATSSP